jgi:hypothetical protein
LRAGIQREPSGGQRAAHDHAVQMDVLAQVLSPGVEDGRETELAAEVARIASEGLQGSSPG